MSVANYTSIPLSRFYVEYPEEFADIWTSPPHALDRYWCSECHRVFFAVDLTIRFEDGFWYSICPYEDCDAIIEDRMYWWYGWPSRVLEGWEVAHVPGKVYSLPHDWRPLPNDEYDRIIDEMNRAVLVT